MVMDSKYIEQLLERYWRCETSLEEEALLRSFFNGDEVPAQLLRYKKLFAYQQVEREIHLDGDFDRKILMQIGEPVVKARKVGLRTRVMPLLKAAAVVALMLSAGSLLKQTYLTDEGEVIMPDTIGRQITAPSVAFSAEQEKGHSSQTLDSLKRMEPRKKTLRQ